MRIPAWIDHTETAMRTPALVHHRPTGLARVRINGRDHDCGRWGTSSATSRYQELLRRASEGRLPGPKRRKRSQPIPAGHSSKPAPSVLDLPATVEGLAALYILRHASLHYRHPDGTPTSELDRTKNSLRWLVKSPEGRLPADQFGPKALKSVRQRMIDAGHCRRPEHYRTATASTGGWQP